MTDDELDERIRGARARLAFPADFQREIWGRIEATESGASPIWLASLWREWLLRIARPVPAVVLVVLMGGGGYVLARVVGGGNARAGEEWTYVRSVSPFAAARIDAER